MLQLSHMLFWKPLHHDNVCVDIGKKFYIIIESVLKRVTCSSRNLSSMLTFVLKLESKTIFTQHKEILLYH